MAFRRQQKALNAYRRTTVSRLLGAVMAFAVLRQKSAAEAFSLFGDYIRLL
jgi:hypothetical protein